MNILSKIDYKTIDYLYLTIDNLNCTTYPQILIINVHFEKLNNLLLGYYNI